MNIKKNQAERISLELHAGQHGWLMRSQVNSAPHSLQQHSEQDGSKTVITNDSSGNPMGTRLW